MLQIARIQIQEGLADAKFLFMAALVLLAFIINAFVYSASYETAQLDFKAAQQAVNVELDSRSDNLQNLVQFGQVMVKAPAAMAFISDSGESKLPNAMVVNAFKVDEPEYISRGNEMFATIPNLDWTFIIGTLMTLMALLLSFSAVCGEKADGTLRLLLSYPVPRVQVIAGKILGLVLVVVAILLLGAFLNLGILYLLDIIPLSATLLLNSAWVLLFALLVLILFVTVGILVSSLTARPAVSLVVLLLLWVFAAVMVPGIAKLIGEQSVDVPSNYEIDRELEQALEEISRKHPDEAGNWHGDPFDENIPLRAAWVREIRDTSQQALDDQLNLYIAQARAIKGYAAVSPVGLLSSCFERFAGTGLTGFRQFLEKAHTYRRQLFEFTRSRDAQDPDSPHLLYSWGENTDRGVFSTKEVDVATVPRSWSLWYGHGVEPLEREPWFELSVLSLLVLLSVVATAIAFSRYDPR